DEHLEALARQPVMALDRLIWIGRGSDRHTLPAPGWFAQLAPQDLRQVALDEDDAREVVAGAEFQMPLVLSRVAILAGMSASTIRVERPLERHSHGLRERRPHVN